MEEAPKIEDAIREKDWRWFGLQERRMTWKLGSTNKYDKWQWIRMDGGKFIYTIIGIALKVLVYRLYTI